MIIVTGGAGFIGSNLVKELNNRGRNDILVVDDLSNGKKFSNLATCDILDYMDKEDFQTFIMDEEAPVDEIEAIFHQGACSTTTEWDGKYMMKTNYEYSQMVLHVCVEHKIPFIYASSAAVYGDGTVFQETREYEKPLNVYGYSKFLFDQYVRKMLLQTQSPIVGLRYFNVYGPQEQHKGSMASVAHHLNNQLIELGYVRLFEGSDGYANGEQRRDFVYVGDVVDVNLWFFEHPRVSGIFNVGTGRSQSFNEVAKAVLDFHQRGRVDYIPFPEHLKGCYQSFTQANIEALRRVGYKKAFKTVEEGVRLYLEQC